MIKKILGFVTVCAIVVVTAYLYGVYQNNRQVSMPEPVQIQQQLDKSIQWLVDNESRILAENNSMLWWMLHEVHKLSQNTHIADLLEKYHQTYPNIKRSIWGPLFDGRKHTRLGSYAVQGLPYYNQHFIYALNCAVDIEDMLPSVAQQNTPAFCHQSAYFYRPACITHQLMGIHFLYTKQCHFLPNIDEVTRSLQADIISQLSWDIRVVDVYLQRVLMLLITGAEASVAPVWIQQVLDQQLSDGGWGDFDTLIGSGASLSLGFSSKILSMGYEKSSFHATAQGVYILTYLQAKH